MSRSIALAAVTAALAYTLAGCGGGEDAAEPAKGPSAVASGATTAPPGQRRNARRGARASAASGTVATLLNRIRVAPESPHAGYERADFPHWIEQDGCNTRQEILIEERRRGTADGCKVSRGKWFSSYDGATFTDPSRLDIDHFIPLEQAFVSGADRWDRATRTSFANDLGYAGSLTAVSAASNRSKGAQDPAEWLPPRAAFRCRYIGTWIAVKYRWRLTADRAEVNTLRRWLRRCGSRANVRRPSRATVKFS